MPLKIRPATASDAPVVVDFNCRLAHETEHKTLDPEIVSQGVAALLADPAKGFYLVAEVNGDVVGQIGVTMEWSDWRNAWHWWIQSVYVRAEARRQGVFRALFREIEEMAHRDGQVIGLRLYVEENNRVAQQTYQGLGMEPMPFLMYHRFPL